MQNILIIGPGAIGGSVGAWLAEHHPQTTVFGRGETARILRERGITTFRRDSAGQLVDRVTVPVRVIDDLREAQDADVVIIATKLYSLEEAAHEVREKVGDRAVVIGMQNGLENQKILPRYFSRVVYCVVGYNARVEAKGVIGYQAKGPLLLGTPDNRLQEEMSAIAKVLNEGVETVVTGRYQDAAHNKLAINLGNSITTLVGLNVAPLQDIGLFQRIISTMLYEGIQVIRAAGYREVRLGDLPPWRVVWASAKLPQWMTKGLFRRNINKMMLSSMGQDIFQRKSSQTELEYLNGYLLSLADRVGTKAPYNRAVYRLCREEFSRPDFQPVPVRRVWEEIEKESR